VACACSRVCSLLSSSYRLYVQLYSCRSMCSIDLQCSSKSYSVNTGSTERARTRHLLLRPQHHQTIANTSRDTLLALGNGLVGWSVGWSVVVIDVRRSSSIQGQPGDHGQPICSIYHAAVRARIRDAIRPGVMRRWSQCPSVFLHIIAYQAGDRVPRPSSS
jgi:hypothetical protein